MNGQRDHSFTLSMLLLKHWSKPNLKLKLSPIHTLVIHSAPRHALELMSSEHWGKK